MLARNTHLRIYDMKNNTSVCSLQQGTQAAFPSVLEGVGSFLESSQQ